MSATNGEACGEAKDKSLFIHALLLVQICKCVVNYSKFLTILASFVKNTPLIIHFSQQYTRMTELLVTTNNCHKKLGTNSLRLGVIDFYIQVNSRSVFLRRYNQVDLSTLTEF